MFVPYALRNGESLVTRGGIWGTRPSGMLACELLDQSMPLTLRNRERLVLEVVYIIYTQNGLVGWETNRTTRYVALNLYEV